MCLDILMSRIIVVNSGVVDYSSTNHQPISTLKDTKRCELDRTVFFKQDTPYILPRLYSVCAYIVHLYTIAHTCMHHAHACAAKQSELVRRCIATTALFALRYILLPGRSAAPACSTWLGLPVWMFFASRYKVIRKHVLAPHVVVRVAQKRVIVSSLLAGVWDSSG